MNFVGHVAVAARCAPERPGFWLGSALPDLAAMGGFRLLGASALDEINDGIAFHHRTDAVFHGHVWFTERMAGLRGDLMVSGLRRGAARAVAHVGPELLLDGRLLLDDDRQIQQALGQIEPLLEAMLPLVDESERSSFGRHLTRVLEVGTPTDYHRADRVAWRLQRILARRPRLAFGDEHVAVVAEHLDAAQDSIDHSAHDFVVEMGTRLA